MFNDVLYYIAYVLQTLSIIYASSLWVAIDTINFALLAHHYVMLKILGSRIASIGWNEENQRITGSGKDYAKLYKCVKYHIQISRWLTWKYIACDYHRTTDTNYSNSKGVNPAFEITKIETEHDAKFCSRYQMESGEIYSDILFAKVTMSVIIICSFVYSLTMVGLHKKKNWSKAYHRNIV